MKHRLLPKWSFLPLALVLAGCASTALAQSGEGAGLERQMTPAEFKAAGLDKLSKDELAALAQWIERQKAGVAARAADAAIGALSEAEVERIREQAREEGRREVKEKSRGFLDFGSDEPITSNIVGEFRGFGQGRQYTLANGQVWEQTEAATLAGVRKTDPAVTIKPGVMNVWYLRVDGYNTTAKVRRVK